MSGNIIELLQNSLDTSTGDTVQFNKFVQSCLEHGSFYNQDKIEAIKVINHSLNSSFDKEKGLILLQNFLSQISVEAFSSNAFSWMVSCNKIISQKEGTNSVLALKVLSKLIELSVKFPEVNKEAAKQIVPKFLLDHVRRKSTPQASVELLGCVQACMSDYPGPSGEFRLDIQKLLLGTVEARGEVVEAASRCVPLVAGVGGGGKQGVSHKTAWQRQQMALVRLLHSLLNLLYEHVDCQVDENTAASEDVELTVELISDRNILTTSQRLATQFTSVAHFLQAMLLYTLLVGKPPFETSTLKETYSHIKRCDYRLPSAIAKRPAGTLINAMLQSEPERRPTIKQILASEFMLEGFLPEQLPVSCLTMAPRNDTLFKNVDSPSRRLPLKEFNNEHSPVPKVPAWPGVGGKPQGITLTAVSNLVPKGRPPRPSLQAAGTMPVMPNKTTEECSAHLRSLAQQLQTLLSAHRSAEAVRHPVSLSNLEELTDPAAQPFVWISKWVDYSDKYGFGYQLCDDGVGVMFNDQTRIVLLPNQMDVHYIERTGEEYYYTMNKTPPEIEKKMKLLSYFRRYMTDHLIKAGAAHARQECDRLTRVPYMQSWKRSSSAVTMHLTNGTVQVNFMDHTKVIVCPLMSAVTFIDDKKNFRTFRLSTLESYISQPQFSRLADCLNYVYKKIPDLITS